MVILGQNPSLPRSVTRRCDRQTPFQTKAPFQGHQTKFSVFKYIPIDNSSKRPTSITEDAQLAPQATIEGSLVTEANDYASSAEADAEAESEAIIDESTWVDPQGEAFSSVVDSLEGTFDEPLFSLSDSSPCSYLAPTSCELASDTEPLGTFSLQGDSSGNSVVSFPSSPLATPLPQIFKPKFYGNSHWINFFRPDPDIISVLQTHESEAPGQGNATLSSCKAMARTIRWHEEASVQMYGTHGELLPPRHVSDRLVEAFLRTYQTILGILHVPTFHKDYQAFWDAPAVSTPAFTLTLLLVMSIGWIFCPHETTISRAVILKWLSVASAGLISLESSTTRNLDGLRVRCLLFLAQRVSSAKGDAQWISAGSLVRMAMGQGLHRDPASHPVGHVSWSEAESRRKLWAAILELEIQSSMDCGGLPCVDCQDYDTALPSNADDFSWALDGAVIEPKPLDQFTSSSFHILLMETLPVRLNIAKLVNGPRCETSFAEALSLSQKLGQLLGLCSARIKAYCFSSNTSPTTFQRKTFELLMRRFLLALHRPFSSMEETCPFSFGSLSVCLESSLAILSTLSNSDDDDFHMAQARGSGMFHRLYIQSALYLCGELRRRAEIESTTSAGSGSNPVHSGMSNLIIQYLHSVPKRMECGDFKVKAYILISASLARIEAPRSAVPPELYISQAVKKGLDNYYARLATRLPPVCPGINDLSPQTTVPPRQQHVVWSPWNQSGSMCSLEEGMEHCDSL
ncbi:hypothetical protein XA68_11354 [Ophiocordyceps unilateralis]|uniref:Xylanolytic transcriptional activator regulatory domain-containing protein n=1 Tax=Ophiocordyceps unilateralis TaxID=268505 RepID=A0A2A9PH64_OPHUN|nr:hypothetical protein XA68_11354 [Ophiocordyceps unilateralis]